MMTDGIPGHGRSEGERAYVESFDHYVDDYLLFIDTVFQRHPQLKQLPRFLSGYAVLVWTAKANSSLIDRSQIVDGWSDRDPGRQYQAELFRWRHAPGPSHRP